VKLKKFYSSREVAGLTGLSARQLQWWDSRRLFVPAIASQRTEAGGFTERRYTPMDVLELQVLADLRRRKFSIPQIRRLLTTLRDVFGIRLYEAIGEGGSMVLFIGGDQLYARTLDGQLFNLDQPTQALMMVGEELPMRPLAARERRRRRPVLRQATEGSKAISTTKGAKATKQTGHDDI
jgi:DNA-binding transcriptional MerR regulator